jgi:hypothetical protein
MIETFNECRKKLVIVQIVFPSALCYSNQIGVEIADAENKEEITVDENPGTGIFGNEPIEPGIKHWERALFS